MLNPQTGVVTGEYHESKNLRDIFDDCDDELK